MRLPSIGQQFHCPTLHPASNMCSGCCACSRGVSQAGAEEAEDSQTHSPWPPGAAEALQPRLSGKRRTQQQLLRDHDHTDQALACDALCSGSTHAPLTHTAVSASCEKLLPALPQAHPSAFAVRSVFVFTLCQARQGCMKIQMWMNTAPLMMWATYAAVSRTSRSSS